MANKKVYDVYLSEFEAKKICNEIKNKGLTLAFVSRQVFADRKRNGKYLDELLRRVINLELGMSQKEYEKLSQYVNGTFLTQDEYQKLRYAEEKLERIEMMLFHSKC